MPLNSVFAGQRVFVLSDDRIGVSIKPIFGSLVDGNQVLAGAHLKEIG